MYNIEIVKKIYRQKKKYIMEIKYKQWKKKLRQWEKYRQWKKNRNSGKKIEKKNQQKKYIVKQKKNIH